MVSDVSISKWGRGECFILPYVIGSQSLRTSKLTITYFTMIISINTNSTALSYLSIITNKTVEMIAMKIFRFLEVATQSHRHEENGGFF